MPKSQAVVGASEARFWLRVFDRWNLSGDTAAAKEEVPLLTVEFNNGNHPSGH